MEECKFKHLCRQLLLNQKCPYDEDMSLCARPAYLSSTMDKTLIPLPKQHLVELYKEEPDANGIVIDNEAFDDLKKIKEGMFNFVKNGCNLCIISANCGNGKTTWARNLMLGYIIDNWNFLSIDKCNAIFISVPDFFRKTKESFSGEKDNIKQITKWIQEARLVVWDEIGIKSLQPWEHELLLSLINERLDNGQANIFTANLETKYENGILVKEGLENKLGPRLFSRIVINSDKVIELFGQDKRGQHF